MKNKGFTLIELLAVIVILAIIALIATPVVLGIIEDSKKSANKVSAQYMVDAVEKAYAIAYTQNSGAVPAVEPASSASEDEVKKTIEGNFSMSGAEWGDSTTEGSTTVYNVHTTDNAVVCNMTVGTENKLSISCSTDGTAIEDLQNIEIGVVNVSGTSVTPDPVEPGGEGA